MRKLTQDDYEAYARRHVPQQPLVWLLIWFGLLSQGSAWTFKHFGGAGVIGFLAVGLSLMACISWRVNARLNLSLARKIASVSNERLRSMIAEVNRETLWGFNQNLALYQLAVRGDEIQSVLPRILGLLTIDHLPTRVRVDEAIDLFPGLRKKIGGYSGFESAKKCREKVAAFQAREQK